MERVVLGIESTAHTYGVGICTLDGHILFNEKSSLTTEQGGIHPREAARHHASYAPDILHKARKFIADSGYEFAGVSVALGPGLGPCLRVGAVSARALSLSESIPLIPVNHSIGHLEIARKFSKTPDPVFLFVSGGNTAVVMHSGDRYRVLGETHDMAIGNMLDVLAREMGFGFPGSPRLLGLAERGGRMLDLPYSVNGQDVSFTGMLTAAKRLLRQGADPVDVAYSVTETAFSMLTEVVERAVALSGRKEVSLTGGVARASNLADKLENMCNERGIEFTVVPAEYAGDNGAMISLVGSLLFSCGRSVKVESSLVKPRWRIEDVEVPWIKSSV